MIERKQGISIVTLEGTPYEIGLQHGELLKKEFGTENIEYYSNYVKHLVEVNIPKGARSLVLQYIDTFMASKLRKNLTLAAKEEIKGLAKGSGLPIKTVLNTAIMPDLFSILIHKTTTMLEKKIPSLGCSSFVLSPQVTSNALMHGRNLDFLGMGKWDKNPLVAVHKPKDAQEYVSVTTAGIGLAGITAMNESGLTLGLHQNFSKDCHNRGTPIIAIGTEVMRQAKTLDEAINIIYAYKPSAGWSFVLSDYKGRESALVEVSGRDIQVLFSPDYLHATNHYQTKKLKENERDCSLVQTIDSKARHFRLEQLIEENYGSIDVKKAIQFLGDHIDPFTGHERTLFNTLTKPHTVSSVLFLPEDRSLWVANGLAPVCNKDYVGFNLDGIELPTIPGNRLADDNQRKSIDYYVQACIDIEDKNDFGSAIIPLELAAMHDPLEAATYDLLGFAQMKTGLYSAARRNFKKSLQCIQTGYRKALNYLFIGHCEDLLGYREEAKANYDAAYDTCENNQIKAFAVKYLKKPYTKKNVKDLAPVSFWAGVLIE